MMANNIQIGMMGDYPLMVNGATGQATKNETQLVAIIAYNAVGGGNGIVVHKDSPFYELADLKGKNVSVPFGSAAHGMMLTSLQKRGLPPDFWNLGRNRRKSAPPICRKNASTRMATSCRSPNCCRSRVSPARSTTAPRPRTSDIPWRRRAQGFWREISGNRGGLPRRVDGGERVDAQESEARGREDRGVDQDQQGSGLHLPRPRRRAHARSDHQAAMDRIRSATITRSCRS